MKDDLAADLLQLLEDSKKHLAENKNVTTDDLMSGMIDETSFMTNLVVYLKNRDLRISDHWYKVGLAAGRKNGEQSPDDRTNITA